MKILIGGGSGFVGKALTEHLESKNHEVSWISRTEGPRMIPWDLEALKASFNHHDAVINLAGENVFSKRWTEEQKKKILKSRVDATDLISEALCEHSGSVTAFINASAIGYYGSHNSTETYDETTPHGHDFLADTCVEWETAARKAEPCVDRLCLVRIGVVLGRGGGALKEMITPFKFFVGGPQGNGKQYVSWIHLQDLVRIFGYFLEKPLAGVFNATSPNPCTNKQLAKAIGKALHRPALIPVPKFVLKLALGEVSELILNGQKVIPQALLTHEFKFDHTSVDMALNDLIGS